MTNEVTRTGLSEDGVLAELTAEFQRALRAAEPIDVDCPLVSLGADSLTMFDLIARIESTYGLSLPISELFDEIDTLRQLARHVANHAPGLAGSSTSDPAPARSDDVPPDQNFYPLTEGQRQTWFLSQRGPDVSRSFNETVLLDLRGDLSLEALVLGIDAVVARHDSLRTVFAPDGSGQRPLPAGPTEVRVTDLRSEPAATRGPMLDEFIREATHHIFDLEHGPPIRVALARVKDSRHLLALTGHDIAVDGWSFEILLEEIAAYYNAAVRGETVELAVPRQYRDFVRARGEHRDGPRWTIDAAYWMQRFADGLPDVQLPWDRTPPPVPSHAGGRVALTLDPSVADRVRVVAQSHGCTPFTVLFAAYAALLHEVCRAEDLVVAVPVTLRADEGGSRIVGNCVNMVAIRSRRRVGDSWRDFVTASRAVLLDAYDHAQLPLSAIRHTWARPGSGQGTPVLPLFNLIQQRQAPELTGLDAEAIVAPRPFATGDLDVSLLASEAGLSCTFAYNTAVFDESTIDKLAQRYRRLLDEIVHDLGQQTVAPAPSGGAPLPTVLELFERQARLSPDTDAVVCGTERLSYADLDRRANQLAHRLAMLGAGPESRVAVSMDRSTNVVVALLGIWKASASFVPLNVDDPVQRRELILRDAGIDILVTTECLAASRTDLVAHVVTVDATADQVAGVADPLPRALYPASLAYVVYTSGSTGRPKGVMGTHGGLASTFRAWQQAVGPRAAEAHLQMANVSFDGFLGETIRALGSGGALIICPREVMLDPPRLLALIAEHNVTIADFVPPVLRTLVPHARRHEHTSLRRLRLLIVGSDLVHTRELATVRELVGADALVVNCYGLSECSIDSTMTVYRPGDERLGDALIGAPMLGVEGWILDGDLRPVAPGEPGTLYIGGSVLSRGYLGDPAKTASRFVPHPYATVPGQRLFNTGDIVQQRMTPDGPQLEYVGRADHQVKVRGYRVELGEIEAALRGLDGVADAAAVATGESNQRKTMAYVTAVEAAGEPDGARWHEGLRAALPYYMVPDQIIAVDRLPMNSNGTVDRAALPRLTGRLVARPATTGPATTATERAMAGIFRQALAVDDLSVHDDFFDLGGDSLLAMRVLGEIATRWGVDVTVGQFFDNPTVSWLSRTVDDVLAAGGSGTDRTAPMPEFRAVPRQVFSLGEEGISR